MYTQETIKAEAEMAATEEDAARKCMFSKREGNRCRGRMRWFAVKEDCDMKTTWYKTITREEWRDLLQQTKKLKAVSG